MDVASFAYPDVNRVVVPVLAGVCDPPRGWSVLPTTGAAEAIAVSMHELAATSRVDSIALPVPSYGSFFGLAKLLGIEVRTYRYQHECGWALDELELIRLAEGCDAVVVINPHNPTGQRTKEATLRKLIDVVAQRDKILLVDEVFRADDEKSIVKHAAGAGCDVVVLGSLSKTYGLPGLRFGWVIAREHRISRMRTVQQYLTLSLSGPAASLAGEVLSNLGAFSRAELIGRNRKLLLEWAAANEDCVSISTPQGGTTVAVQFKVATSEDKLFDALVGAGVLLVPGSRFGPPTTPVWFRLGYGTDTSKLEKGLQRVKDTINEFRHS